MMRSLSIECVVMRTQAIRMICDIEEACFAMEKAMQPRDAPGLPGAQGGKGEGR
jgi:hypothetical protein